MIHLDVKPGNVLLTKQFEPILSDFGSARVTERGTGVHTTAGTCVFRAPEVIVQKEYAKTQEKTRTPKPKPVHSYADIFSYGALLVCVALRQWTPYDEAITMAKVECGVARGLLRPQLIATHPWSHIVTACTKLAPLERPSAQRVMDKIDAVAKAVDSQPHRWAP